MEISVTMILQCVSWITLLLSVAFSLGRPSSCCGSIPFAPLLCWIYFLDAKLSLLIFSFIWWSISSSSWLTKRIKGVKYLRPCVSENVFNYEVWEWDGLIGYRLKGGCSFPSEVWRNYSIAFLFPELLLEIWSHSNCQSFIRELISLPLEVCNVILVPTVWNSFR